jgi:hypothetical protein
MHMIMTLKRRSVNVPDEVPHSLRGLLNSAPLDQPQDFGFMAAPQSGMMAPGMPQMSHMTPGMGAAPSQKPSKPDAFDFGNVKEMVSQIQPKPEEIMGDFQDSPPLMPSFPDHSQKPRHQDPAPQYPSLSDQPHKPQTRYVEPTPSMSQEYSVKSKPSFEDSSDNDPMKPVLVQQYSSVLASIKKIQGALELADNFASHKPVLQDISAKLSDLLRKLDKPSSHSSVEERQEPPPPKQILKQPRQEDLMGNGDPVRKSQVKFNLEPQPQHAKSLPDDDLFAFPSGSSSSSMQSSSMTYPSLEASQGPSQFSSAQTQFSFAPGASQPKPSFQASFEF